MRSRFRSTRGLPTAILTGCLLWAGCAPMIHYSGKNIAKLKTRDQVHKALGTPSNIGRRAEEDGQFEEFQTRAKIADPKAGDYNLLLDSASLGLYEIYSFPRTLGELAFSTCVGQTVRIDYDDDGKVIGSRIDLNVSKEHKDSSEKKP